MKESSQELQNQIKHPTNFLMSLNTQNSSERVAEYTVRWGTHRKEFIIVNFISMTEILSKLIF